MNDRYAVIGATKDGFRICRSFPCLLRAYQYMAAHIDNANTLWVRDFSSDTVMVWVNAISIVPPSQRRWSSAI